MMRNSDIPIEGILKYIKADRDKYKAQLEELIPYTHSLESKNEQLNEKNSALLTENKALQREVMKSAPYVGLMKKYTSLKRDYSELLSKLYSKKPLIWQMVAIIITIYEQELESGNISRHGDISDLRPNSELILKKYLQWITEK